MAPQRGEPDSAVALMLSARRERRQRNLRALEIPDDDVTVTDELLGTGGFGTVYMADYNGRNAAAKVNSLIDSKVATDEFTASSNVKETASPTAIRNRN